MTDGKLKPAQAIAVDDGIAADPKGKEPGQVAFEARAPFIPGFLPWGEQCRDNQQNWARVERAVLSAYAQPYNHGFADGEIAQALRAPADHDMDWQDDVCCRLGLDTAAGMKWKPAEVFQHVEEQIARAAQPDQSQRVRKLEGRLIARAEQMARTASDHKPASKARAFCEGRAAGLRDAIAALSRQSTGGE